jgi:signal transduction histidine kinase
MSTRLVAPPPAMAEYEGSMTLTLSRDTLGAARTAITGPCWRLLAETSGLLDRSLDYQETLTNVAQSVLPRIADCVVIALTAPNGSVTGDFSAHRNPERNELLGRLSSCWSHRSRANRWLAEMLRATETQIIESVDNVFLESVDADDGLRAILRELAPLSMIFLPLKARQQRLGCLVLATTSDSNRTYKRRDVAVANEVARRAALAIDRALLYRTAEQAARVREEMMAIVSHDLKNPLATIQMAVQFLLEDIVPNDSVHEPGRVQLQVIYRSAKRMYRLVHDLLDAAAMEAGQLPIDPTSLAVDVLIGDALELLRPLAAAKRISLTVETEPALPKVRADRERILQVFSNLGGNALKFTPDDGLVEIRAALRAGKVEFTVRDTGTGISPNDLPHIFERFWQAKKTQNGVGLGLAITRGIVQAHGGEIRVESAVGCGTTFRFTLPVVS